MKLITDTDYCPVRNFDNVCSLCNCECISGEALTRDCPLIRNGGIPLPKGHGRLIDADALKTTRTMALVEEKNAPKNSIVFAPLVCVLKENIDDAPAIVEADKENDNGTNNQD